MIKFYKILISLSLMICFSGCAVAQKKIADPTDFVKVKQHQFFINNKPYYYIGANYWYGGLLALQDDPKRGKERLVKELDFLKAMGITNLRVLVGSEGEGMINGVKRVTPVLQPEEGKYDEKVLNSLDFFLSEMRKRKMYAVLYLSNNWEWSGGFLQYLNWHSLVDKETLTRKLSWDEQRELTSKFYTCEACMKSYTMQLEYIFNHISTVTGKTYAEEPAIMAWELANEPRPMRTEVIPQYKAWIKATSEFIKSKDSHHLVTIGTEGVMGTDENPELFKEIHQPSAIDYLTLHIWPKNWGWFTGTDVAGGLQGTVDKTIAYLKVHEKLAQEINKPLVIEEFGLPREGHSFDPGATTLSRDKYYEAIFSYWNQSRLNKGVIAGSNFWAFGGTSRPLAGQIFWKDGDDFSGDPPQEEQGLNAVFDSDASTWKVVQSFSKSLQ